MRLRRLTALALVAVALAVTTPAGACGPRELGIVDDWLEAVDDASRAGDFDQAVSYANAAVSEARRGKVFPACTIPLTAARLEQAERRRDYVERHGRSIAAVDAALRIEAVYPQGLSCP